MNWELLNNRAYVPYSKKPRACVVQGSGGNLYVGVRIENVSFPLTITAIQAACFSCLSEGEIPLTLFLEDTHFDQLNFWEAEFELNIKLGSPIPDGNFSNLVQLEIPNEKEVLKVLLDTAITTNSNFPVSCLLFSDLGYVTGVNIEVSDWALGLCAERVALSKAISSGITTFSSIAVHTKLGDVSSPCGACRQVLIEHLPLNKVRMYHANDTFSEHFSVDLLPFSFTSKSLKK